MLEKLLALDTSLLISARGLVGSEYTKVVKLLGESVVVWVALMLIWMWLYGIKRQDNRYKVIAFSVFSTIILTFILYTIINFGIPQWRPSPQSVVGGVKALIDHPLDNSFPSGHALFTGATIIALIRFLPWKSLIALTILFGLMTACARVLGGVHYPGDILGGWIFGALGAWISLFLVDTAFFREKIAGNIVAMARFLKL